MKIKVTSTCTLTDMKKYHIASVHVVMFRFLPDLNTGYNFNSSYF